MDKNKVLVDSNLSSSKSFKCLPFQSTFNLGKNARSCENGRQPLLSSSIIVSRHSLYHLYHLYTNDCATDCFLTDVFNISMV